MKNEESPSDTGSRDRRETEEHAQLALRKLQQSFLRYEQLSARADTLDVTEGSSLARDRDAAAYNSLPDFVFNGLAVALDHLHGLKLSVEGSGGGILAMSSFTLIRSAYEATGTGLWVLQPESRDERLLRSRRLVRENRRQLRTLQGELGLSDPGFARSETRLKQQLEGRGAVADEPLDKATGVTDRLAAIAHLFPAMSHPPLILWRMASGIAHNNTFMMIKLLEREQLNPHDGGSAEYKVTSSFGMVATFYDAALTMVEALMDLYEIRNLPTLSDE